MALRLISYDCFIRPFYIRATLALQHGTEIQVESKLAKTAKFKLIAI